MSRVLAIVAHPDDESYGCGGTLLTRHADDEVHIIVLADGERSGNRDQREAHQSLVQTRRKMAQAAGAVLKIDEFHFLGYSDQELDRYPLLELVRAVSSISDQIQPEVVYLHSQADLNLDHRIAGQAALTALRPVPESKVIEMFAFEVPGSAWSTAQIGRTFVPQYFVDISQTIEEKKKALSCYASEIRSTPHPHSLEMVETAAGRNGSLCGRSYAESFEVVRLVR